MQPISTHITPPSNTFSSYRPGGGRIASDRYRRSLEQSEAFTGLEAGFTRFDLLLLVKRVGRDYGFSPKMIQLIEYYLTVFTRDIDWEQGRPVVYQSLSKTSLDLGVSERQIQKLEKQLFEIGAIGYVDSGNCKRYGQRDLKTGRIAYAFGVDLSPLAHLRAELEDHLHQKELYNRAWQQTKREISGQRRQIRSLILEWQEEGSDLPELVEFEKAYQPIAMQLRTHIHLEDLRALLLRHQSLHKRLIDAMGVGEKDQQAVLQQRSMAKETPSSTSTNTVRDVHKEYTNQSLIICSRSDQGIQGSVTQRPVPTDQIPCSGVQHVTLKQVRLVVSDRFRNHLPLEIDSTTWGDVVEAAYRLRDELGVSQTSWGEACELLGRTGAALCLLITDRAALREDQPAQLPAAYFRGMVNRARKGELHLHSSIFGLLGK